MNQKEIFDEILSFLEILRMRTIRDKPIENHLRNLWEIFRTTVDRQVFEGNVQFLNELCNTFTPLKKARISIDILWISQIFHKWMRKVFRIRRFQQTTYAGFEKFWRPYLFFGSSRKNYRHPSGASVPEAPTPRQTQEISPSLTLNRSIFCKGQRGNKFHERFIHHKPLNSLGSFVIESVVSLKTHVGKI